MKQILIKRGEAILEEVPAPGVEAGTVLVRVDHSCISVGTEMAGVRMTGLPLWKRAMKQPDNVRRVVRMAMSDGLAKTRSVVEAKVALGEPTGYSVAGVVVEVGAGVDDLAPGERVACAGAQYAHHAETVRVPRNLVVPIPDGVPFVEACTVTLGAIALQGVRRASPTLGETFVVVGLGFLGQLTAQMLRANGCRVIGTDLEPARVRAALALGMDLALSPDDGVDVEQVARLTDGIGADGVIVTASSPSDLIMSAAFQMCRKKGRVVLVGDVGLNLNRSDFYPKELDFFISTSYGPGRYDRRYEEEGLDYPVSYVRWTENRNMAEYLRLLAEGKVRLDGLMGRVYPIEEAPQAYEALKGGQAPLLVPICYPSASTGDRLDRVIPNPSAPGGRPGAVRLALVGAGNFAKGMHLPNLRLMADLWTLQAVVSRTGHNAALTAKQFGAAYSSSDFNAVLSDAKVDAVLIATRHDLHARMAIQAIEAGKHVLLEKPLALTRSDMERIRRAYETAGDGAPILLTGFNRRFSRFAQACATVTRRRSNPMVINYRMNAGYIPLDSWVHGPEGGGRNLGEACHIYDLFTFLTGSRVVDVQAHAVVATTGYYTGRDNFVASMRFEDGSVASLTYTAMGAKEHPKEQMEIFVDGKVLVLDDYRTLSCRGGRVPSVSSRAPDKGQREEMEAFGRAIQQGGEWPIPLWQQLQATEIAFRVEELISGQSAAEVVR